MSTAQTTAERLADRYGRGPASGARRAVWVVVAVLVAAVVGWVAWSTVSNAMRSVDYDTLGFHDLDEHAVTVEFQVVANPGTAYACAIEAQDAEHGVVGWRVVEYGATDAHTRRFSETIPTVSEATTGLVTSCWIP